MAGFFSELLLVNLALGLFNLLPAFPMDGGRVLRALLSGWVGRARATTIAARIGQFLAVFLGGMLFLWSQNPIHLALAAFIFFAARAEEAQVLFEERRRQWAGAAANQGIWTAPPGYRWVHRGNGTWQLAPVTVWLGRPRPRRRPMALIPIVELGVSEAYALLTERFGVIDLPPLDAIENEDWGRDYLLTRLSEMTASAARRGRPLPRSRSKLH